MTGEQWSVSSVTSHGQQQFMGAGLSLLVLVLVVTVIKLGLAHPPLITVESTEEIFKIFY